jgi:UDP-glucose 4-epimerase
VTRTTVLVAGGAGYIGSHATRHLLDQGYAVVVVDDLSHGHRQAVDHRAAFVKASIADRSEMTSTLREYSVSAVMHFAAYIEVAESVADPARYYANNVRGSLALLDAMRETDVRRLVFSSTAAVYGQPTQIPINETQARLPINPYGRTKSVIEDAIEDYAHAYGLGAVALRYFNVAGAAPDGSIGEQHEPETHLIPRLLDTACDEGGTAEIFGTDYPTRDGTCVRDYVHVEDLVDAHVLALEAASPGTGKCAYNLGSEQGFTVREVLEACREVTGHPIPAVERGRRAGDPAALIADSSKIRRELAWEPKRADLRTIVQDAWRWHCRKSPRR